MRPPDQTVAPSGRRLRGVTVGLGALVTGFAWWLRAAPLAPGSLWLDDLWVVAPSQAASVRDALSMLVTSPGFSIVVNLPLAVTGPSSLVAQTLPFAAGVAAPVVAYVVARQIGTGRPAAWVAAVATAVAPEHVVFSTRVKQYTVEALVGLVAIALAVRIIERRSSPWSLAALAVVATTVSGSAGVFVGAALGAAVVASNGWDQRVRALRAAGAFGAFALLWWALYLRSHVTEGLRDFWRDDFLATGDGVRAFLADLGSALDHLTGSMVPLAPAWPWVGVAAVVVAVRRPRLALVLATPVLAAVVLAGLGAAPLGTGRTDIHLLPAVALTLGLAVDAVPVRLRRRLPARAGAAALVAIVLVVAVLVRDLRPHEYPPADVRDLISAAERDRSADGVIVVYPSTRWAYAVYAGGGFRPVPDDNETGFDVRITTPGVEVLRPHREDRAGYAEDLAAATENSRTATLVASQWTTDIDDVLGWFPAHGWTETGRVRREAALLVTWTRTG